MLSIGTIDAMDLDRVNFRLGLTIRYWPTGQRRRAVEEFDALAPMLARFDQLVAQEGVGLVTDDGLYWRTWQRGVRVMMIEGKLSPNDVRRLQARFEAAHSGPWPVEAAEPDWRPGVAPDGSALGLFDCGACGRNIFREDTADCPQCERRHNVKRMVMAMEPPRPPGFGDVMREWGRIFRRSLP